VQASPAALRPGVWRLMLTFLRSAVAQTSPNLLNLLRLFKPWLKHAVPIAANNAEATGMVVDLRVQAEEGAGLEIRLLARSATWRAAVCLRWPWRRLRQLPACGEPRCLPALPCLAQ